MNELLESDLKILYKIVEYTIDICNVYSRMFSISDFSTDNNNKEEFIGLVSILKGLVKEEDELYKQLNLTKEKSNNLWEYFVRRYNINEDEHNFQFADACNEEISNIWHYRIRNKLDYYVPEYEENSEYVKSLKEEFGDSLAAQEYLQEGKFREAINNDFERAFIYFLKEEIHNSDDHWMNYYCYEALYNLSFITPNLENELLDVNFEMSKDLYFLSPIVADRLRITSSFMEEIQEDATYSYCNDAIEALNQLQQTDLGDSYIDYNVNLLSIYFRAGLAISYNRKSYKEIVDNTVAQIEFKDDSEYDNSDFVDSCLEKTKTDIQKCKYLSLFNRNRY